MPENEELLNEDALFDDAVGDVEAQPEPAPVEQPAPQAETTEAKPETEPEREKVDDDAPQVPSWRVREINEEKRAAIAERDALRAERDNLARQQAEFQRHMAQQKQPEQPNEPDEPDPLLDPRGYRNYMKQMVDERLLAERRESSLKDAQRTYKQEFDEAYATATRQVDPILRARMQQSNDPGETLMGWFRELKVRNEVGSDLKAYKDKVRSEFLKDPEFRKAAMEAWRGEASSQVSGRPNVQLPPSMNGISRSSAALRASQSDLSDDDLWDTTTT